jgi:hypothetical protein
VHEQRRGRVVEGIVAVALLAAVQVAVDDGLQARCDRDRAFLVAFAADLQAPRPRRAGDAVKPEGDALGEADAGDAVQSDQRDAACGPALCALGSGVAAARSSV